MQGRVVLLFVILVSAGSVDCSPLQWVVTPSRLPITSGHHRTFFDGLDSIYLAGGWNGSWNHPWNNQVFKYSVSTGSVDVHGEFVQSSSGAGFIYERDIYLLGGAKKDSPSYISNISSYSTETGSYNTVNNLPVEQSGMGFAWSPSQQVLYTFGGNANFEFPTNFQNAVLQYNPRTNELTQVATLPEGRYGSAAVWTPDDDGRVYVFGGETESVGVDYDIFQFDTITRNVTKMGTRLPLPARSSCAVYVPREHSVYIINFRGHMRFNTLTLETTVIEKDSSWPVEYNGGGCIYVEHLDRIYMMGGFGRFSEESDSQFMSRISYIQLEQSEQPIEESTTEAPPTEDDCSDGANKIIPDPECCTRFIVCIFGSPTVYDCDEGKQFNHKTLQCDDKHVVKCEIRYLE